LQRMLPAIIDVVKQVEDLLNVRVIAVTQKKKCKLEMNHVVIPTRWAMVDLCQRDRCATLVGITSVGGELDMNIAKTTRVIGAANMATNEAAGMITVVILGKDATRTDADATKIREYESAFPRPTLSYKKEL